MDKTLTLMRGLSGSGKSTFARENLEGTLLSTDDFFVDRDGNYKYDLELQGKAHRRCKDRCHHAMIRGDQHIIIDNTNYAYWHMEPFWRLAKEYGYEIKLMLVGKTDEHTAVSEYFERNVHQVPQKVLRGQAQKFEKWDDVTTGMKLLKASQCLQSALIANDRIYVREAQEYLNQVLTEEVGLRRPT